MDIAAEVKFKNYRIQQYISGTIKVLIGDECMSPTIPHLREIAQKINVNSLNGNENPKNTRTLGADVIKELNSGR